MNLEIENICQSIIDSKLYDDPFDHLYINNFFSESFYNKLLKFLPKKDQYTQINKTKSVSADYPDERYIYNITKESFVNFYPEQKVFFGELLNSLLSLEFYYKVTEKFFQNDCSVKPQDINLRMALVKDFTKYNLGAHTDHPNKFMTFLFYLPVDNSHKHIGTSLYQLKKSENKDIKSSKHYSEKDTKELFVEKKLAEFLPNSVLIFPRTNLSYHGVSSINVGSYERNLLLLNYNFK